MKKILLNNSKTQKKLNKLPKIYLVALWAKYTVIELPFTGKFVKQDGVYIPLVYNYVDFNGESDEYHLTKITLVTSGGCLIWTQYKNIANKIADLYNEHIN